MEEQRIKNIKGNNEKNVKEGGLAVLDLKLYYKAVIIKIIWYRLRDRSNCKNINCSWAGQANIIKMTILPKLIYLFGTIPNKLSRNFFIELEKTITTYIWWNKRSRISREIMKKNVKEGGLAVPDIKLYYKADVVKTIWYWGAAGVA